MKDWEVVADNLSKAGWSLGWVSAIDCEGQTIWIVDAHRGDGQRFIWPVFVLSPCSVFAGEKHAIPAVYACDKARQYSAVRIRGRPRLSILSTNIRPSIILLRQSRSEVPENLPKSGDFTAFLELEAAIQDYGELACQAGKKHLSAQK